MNTFSNIFNIFIDKLIRISIFDKLILINTVFAIFGIVLPVARYYIFESYFYINNSLAVYLIGIVIIMLLSIFFPKTTGVIIRILINAYYLFWIVYLHISGELTKADPYELSIGYYFNLAIPFLFLVLSFLSFFFTDE